MKRTRYYRVGSFTAKQTSDNKGFWLKPSFKVEGSAEICGLSNTNDLKKQFDEVIDILGQWALEVGGL